MMMQYVMEPDSSLIIENNEQIVNETIQQIYQLFDQLQRSLLNFASPNKLFSSVDKIFNDLDQIFRRLNDRTRYYSSDIINMFEIILKNYLDLIDMNQFIDIIAQHYACINNLVFGSFFEALDQEDTLNVVKKMPIKTRQQMYYRILDQISTSKQIHSFLKNKLSASTTNEHIERIVKHFCGSILVMVLRILIHLNVNLLDIEFRKYQNTLLIPLVQFIDEHLIKDQCSENDILIKEILEYFYITSNQTLTIPIFINAHCPEICLRWLLLPYLNSYEYVYILRTLYNIARHDDGVIILNKYQCYTVLMKFNKEILTTHIDFIINKLLYEELQLIYFMIIVLIVNRNQLVPETTDWFMQYRLSSVIFDSILIRSFRYRNFHMSELMIVLMKLSTDDNFIHALSVKHYFKLPEYIFNVLKFLLHCVEIQRFDYHNLSSDILTITTLANILWSISFHDMYKNVLNENIEIINRLVTLDTSDIIEKILPHMYIPRHMSSLKRAIDGIFQNLHPTSNVNVEMNSTIQNKFFCSIMISYSYLNIDFCRELYNILNTIPQLSISINFNTGKYLWNDIKETIENSDLVLFLISNDFFNSKSCRQEFIYVTDILKKPFIPIIISTDYEITQWLKTPINQTKHVLFDENKDFLDNCNELILLIKENLSLNIQLTRNASDTRQWSEQDVKEWFNNNNLISELHEFYQFKNGNELLLYAKAVSTLTWTKEYERIRARFEEKFKQQQLDLSSHEFLKLINALECLKNKYLSTI